MEWEGKSRRAELLEPKSLERKSTLLLVLLLLVVSHDPCGPVQLGTGHERVQGISEDDKVFGAVEVGALVEAGQVDVDAGQSGHDGAGGFVDRTESATGRRIFTHKHGEDGAAMIMIIGGGWWFCKGLLFVREFELSAGAERQLDVHLLLSSMVSIGQLWTVKQSVSWLVSKSFSLGH